MLEINAYKNNNNKSAITSQVKRNAVQNTTTTTTTGRYLLTSKANQTEPSNNKKDLSNELGFEIKFVEYCHIGTISSKFYDKILH